MYTLIEKTKNVQNPNMKSVKSKKATNIISDTVKAIEAFRDLTPRTYLLCRYQAYC